MSIADDVFEREGKMEVEEGEEGTELVDGYSKRERGVLNNKWYIENLGQESVTTSNSYIIIVKDKEKKTGVDFCRLPAVHVPRGSCERGRGRGRQSELESELKIKPLHWLPVVLDTLKVKQLLVARVTLAREMFVGIRAQQFSAAPIAKVLRAFPTCHL